MWSQSIPDFPSTSCRSPREGNRPFSPPWHWCHFLSDSPAVWCVQKSCLRGEQRLRVTDAGQLLCHRVRRLLTSAFLKNYKPPAKQDNFSSFLFCITTLPSQMQQFKSKSRNYKSIQIYMKLNFWRNSTEVLSLKKNSRYPWCLSHPRTCSVLENWYCIFVSLLAPKCHFSAFHELSKPIWPPGLGHMPAKARGQVCKLKRILFSTL